MSVSMHHAADILAQMADVEAAELLKMINPVLMTGPVLTTITDIIGVPIYLGLSTTFLASMLM